MKHTLTDLQEVNKTLKEHTKQDAESFAAMAQADKELKEVIEECRDAIRELRESVKHLDNTVVPIAKAYDGFLFGRNFIVGLSSVIPSQRV